MSVVAVTWHDAHSGTETWCAIKDLDTDPAIVETVGFLLPTADGGKPGHLTIYQSRQEDNIDHVLHIPEPMVQRVKVLFELENNLQNREN